MNKRVWISQLSQFDGKNVELKGWVVHKRSSGKKLRFLVMRDGTGFLQCILVDGETSPASLEAFDQMTQESSIELSGVVKKEPRSSGGYEVLVKSAKVVHLAKPYPISPKEHGVEFLMEHRHLWIRSSRQWAALRIRSELLAAIPAFFAEREFVHFDAPILTPNSCEGTSTLFSTPYFEEKAFLTQSGQLYGEAGAMAFGKIYVYGPTFRAEKSKTRKHLTEFWMLEPEMAFANIIDSMELGEELIIYLIQRVLSRCKDELKLLERDISKLESIQAPFPRCSYDEAISILSKTDVPLPWGDDFGAPHEARLSEHFKKPVFIHHMPSQIKAFYFKQSDDISLPPLAASPMNGKYALGCDLIAPEGYGEIIGGGQREENVDILEKRIQEHGLRLEDYQWYLDLRRYGSVPHAGFGLGLERTVAWITGVEHVRETIPFPRMLQTLRP